MTEARARAMDAVETGSILNTRGVFRALGLAGLLLVLPACVVSLSALVVPMALMFASSLASGEGGSGFSAYIGILSDPFYYGVLFNTLRMAAVVTLICVVVGWPIAFQIAQSGRRGKLLMTTLVLAPLLVSVVVRTFGWIILLGPGGPVARLLAIFGIDPSGRGILYSETAVVIGMVHILLPIMIISIVAGMNRLDVAIFRAAVNLGAPPAKAILSVFLPASMPGILAGSTIVFGLASSAYITPSVLGGATKVYMSTLIFQSNMVHLNFPFGAALALTLLLTTLLVVLALTLLFEKVLFRGVFLPESRSP